MTKLTENCQDKTIHFGGQCAVSENEIYRMIEAVKDEIITAIQSAKPDVLDKKRVIEIIRGVE